VPLQSWYSGSRAKYWIVRTDNVGYKSNQQVAAAEQEEAELLEKFEYAEVQRLILQERDDASWDTEVESSDTTPWLQYTKWPKQFAHRPLEVIAAAARRPESYPCDDYLLGFWNGSELRSPVEDEVKIQALLYLLETMFQRCHETLDLSSHQLRCWVKSFKADVFYPYPLKPLQCQGSRDGYIGLWMRFFCYVFRVWALPPNLRSEVFGLRLSQQQLETISKIWDALDGRREVERTTREDSSRSRSSQESGYRSEFSTSPLHRSSFEEGLSGEFDSFQLSPHMAARVTEWLFALSCQFVAQIARPGEEQTLPLVHFTGVLGIHSYSLVYRTA
jgi:hypothetical protein